MVGRLTPLWIPAWGRLEALKRISAHTLFQWVVEGLPRAYRLRMPPHIKYLEAAGAIADGRVKVLEQSDERVEAEVESSTGERSYRVVLALGGDGRLYAYSDDNGTRYKGYVGYPIISLMMVTGRLPRDEAVEEALKGIPWKTLNEKYKRYELVMEEVTAQAEARGVSGERIHGFIGEVKRRLSETELYYAESLAGSRRWHEGGFR